MTSILGDIADGFITCDRAWRITFVNQRAAEIIGHPAATLIGQILWTIYPDADDSEARVEFQRARTQQEPVHFQEFNSHLNIWIEVHAYPVESGLTIYLQNITTRKQIDAALQRTWQTLEHQLQDHQNEIKRVSALVASQTAETQHAEELLRTTNAHLATIFESITDAFYAIDRRWQFIYVNQRAEQLLQKNQTELLGRSLWDVYPNLEETEFYHRCHTVIETQIPMQFEEFCVTLNLWLSVHLYPSRLGLSVYFQDITQRKQMEEERHHLLTFLAEASAVLASSLDYETTLTSVAQLVVPFLADFCLIHRLDSHGQLHQVTAVHHDPQKQRLVDELATYYPTFLQQPHSIAAQALRTREPLLVATFSESIARTITQDARMLELYRELAPQSAMLVPLVARGQSLGAITLMTAEPDRCYNNADLSLAIDLGRRAAMAIDNAELYQKAQESNRLKDEFLSTLSHELRTPLNAILGWATILLTHTPTEQAKRQAIETIERKARSLVQLIYDLLDMARIVTGTFRLAPTWVDVTLIVAEAMASLQLAIEAKSIQVSVHADSALEPIWGDRKYLRQIIWNLLSNAVKFTAANGQVEVHLTRRETVTQIQVCDTGRGIAPEFLPYVFDRFRQADSSMRRQHGGLGLGLALVYYLVELHGGTIEASSAGEGMGAAFTVSLPVPSLSSSSIAPAAETSAVASLSNRCLSGIQLLLVEDDADSSELLTIALAQEGATVTAVGSVSEAINLLEHLKPDLVISDIGLPEEDGYALMAHLNQLNATQQDRIPAIALTAFASDDECTRVLAAGFQWYLSKPIDPDELIRIVVRVVAATQQRHPLEDDPT